MKEAWEKTIKSFKQSMPIMVGVLLLVNLAYPLLAKYYDSIFVGNIILDPLIGAVAGSISFGMPIVSFVVGGELLDKGVGLLAVTAFILSWSTVGVAMLPLEIKYLGKSFAIWRNAINFVFAIAIAVLTILTIKLV